MTIYNAGKTQSFSRSQCGNPYMYTGRRLDDETGLYYYRARMYSPAIGRFLQTDPLGYYDSMNLYAYVNNNPLNWTDPWGLSSLGLATTNGHSWLEYTDDDGVRSTYGLYHRSAVGRGSGSSLSGYTSSGISSIGGISLGGLPVGASFGLSGSSIGSSSGPSSGSSKGDPYESMRIHPKGDLYKDMELAYDPLAIYTVTLTPQQDTRFHEIIQEEHNYLFPVQNCSSWAADTFEEVTGIEDLDENSLLLGVGHPRGLRKDIEEKCEK